MKIREVKGVMRKIYSLMLAVALSAVLLMPGIGHAQTETTTQGSTEEATTQESTTEEESSGSGRAKSRQDRIDTYKQKVTEKLSAAKERRITNGCKAAQGKVTSMQNNLSKAITNRKGVYTNIKERLDAVVLKLQAASVDTAELELAIADIEAQSSAIVDKVEAYNETLSDLAAMDCAADPEGFAAALTTAREQRNEIVTMAQALKSFVRNDVKSLLQTIRQQLSSTDSQETDQATPES